MSALLTREDVRDELRHFLWDTFSNEIKDLGERVQKDIKTELRRFLTAQASGKDGVKFSVEQPTKRAQIEPDKVDNTASKGGGNSLKHPGAPDGAPVLAWGTDDTELIELPEDYKLAQNSQLLGRTGQCASNELEKTATEKVVDAWTCKTAKTTAKLKDVDEVITYNDDSLDDLRSDPPASSPRSSLPRQQTESSLPSFGSQLRRPLPSERARPLSTRLMKHRASHDSLLKRMQGGSPRRSVIALPRWISLMHRAVKHEWFDYIMGVFLVANALSIGWQTDYMAKHDDATAPGYFRAIEAIFCVIFALELFARLMVYRRRLYQMPGWQWNVFDTLLVIIQITDELTMLILTGGAVKEAVEKMGVMRILRLGRVIRLIRMVRLIPELKSMVYLISASMWSFFWTLMLLLLLMYCFAVYYTEQSTVIAKEHSGQYATDIREQWGSVSKSVLTLYQAITGGDDWHNFIRVFEGDSTYIINTLIFCAYIAFAILVMLNLVTGVFVEGAQRIIKEDKDNDMIRQVCKLFKAADIDGNHTISYDEFQAQIDSNRMDEYFRNVELSRQEATHLFKLLDVDRSDSLSVEEFVRGTLRLKGPARSVDLAALSYDFNSTKNSVIKIEANLAHMIHILGKVASQETRPFTTVMADGEEV